MDFGIEKCAIIIMRSGKQEMMEGTELPNEEKIREHREKETWEYWKWKPSNK